MQLEYSRYAVSDRNEVFPAQYRKPEYMIKLMHQQDYFSRAQQSIKL
jgi:hypothetical protein